MKQTPLLFNSDMVNALLGGYKTMTRRQINRLLGFGKITEFGKSDTKGYDWHFRDKEMRWHDISNERLLELCPYGMKGDLIWVRETWKASSIDDSNKPSELSNLSEIVYMADNSSNTKEEQFLCMGKTRQSIFMPKWASRLTLKITGVRVERVQDISEEDAKAEGVWHNKELNRFRMKKDIGAYLVYARGAFQWLWNSINNNWDDNPFVWIISFEVIKENIDSYLDRQT